MSETKPTPGGQIIVENSKEIAQLTAGDIQMIKNKFKKKKTIVFYCMAIFFVAGTLISLYAVLEYGLARFENYVPLIIGAVAVLICSLVLVMFNQEIKLELSNNKKFIYKGIVTNRAETSSRYGVGNNREFYFSNYICLGDEISFENKDLYYQINVGDTIDVQISEKLNIVLYKRIEKKKSVADAMPEVIAEHGPILEIKYKQGVNQRTELLSDEERDALTALKKRRSKRILIVGIIFLLGIGASVEVYLWIDPYYSWDEILAFRLGFWGIPLAFFSLLFYRRTVPLTKDIRAAEKIIISEKLINKEKSYSEAAKASTYSIKGVRENMDVSKDFFDSIGPGDDFEIHKTLVRNKMLMVVLLKSNLRYRNPDIFKKQLN